MSIRKKLFQAMAIALLCVPMTTGAAESITVNIPSGDLAAALESFAKQSGIELVFRADQVKGIHTRGISGTLTPAGAIQKLLEGTAFRLETDAATGAMVVTVAQRAGALQGANGGDLSFHGSDAGYIALRIAENETLEQRAEQDASSSQQDSEGGSGNYDQGQRTGSSTEASQKFEEIVVTAQRREQKLHDVPFGVSALTTKDLERIGASGYQDILATLPGVQYAGSSRGRNVITIRGVSTNSTGFANDQSPTEQYLDDLPLTNRFSPWGGTDLEPFDLERVELLRGPQGTLFGSGAMGGALRYITNKPNLSQYQAKIEMGQSYTHGGDDSNRIAGMVNVPLIDDQLALRLVAYRRHDGGWVDNIHRERENENSGTQTGGRFMLTYQPTHSLKLGFLALYDNTLVDGSPLTFLNAADGARDQSQGVIDDTTDGKLDMYSFTIDYDLGWVSIASITTYATRDMFLSTDWVRLFDALYTGGTGLDPDNNIMFLRQNTKRLAQEVRVSSDGDGSLQWLVGGFFMDYNHDSDQLWDFGIGQPNHLLFLDDISFIDVREIAIFGEATYRLTEKLSVTAGARVFRNTFGSELISNPAAAYRTGSPFAEESSSAVTPKLSVSFYPRAGLHLYATAARGYRVGQVNLNYAFDPMIPKGYDPDSLWSYEVGVKSLWLDGRLQANIGGFFIDWEDIQLTRYLPNGTGNHIANGGVAEIKGVEAEFVARPVDAIEIGSSLTYNDGKLVSVLPGVALIPGSRLPGTPKFSAANYIEGTAEFGRDLSGYVRLAHRYVGKMPNNNLADANAALADAYHNFDLRTGVQYQNYELSLYIDNLTDNDSPTTGAAAFTADIAPMVARPIPRTVGLTVRANF